MRLVVNIFDYRTAYIKRKESGAFISKSAVSGQDLASLDTYTGLPHELEQEILARYHDLERRVRLPSDIWQDLNNPDSFTAALADREAVAEDHEGRSSKSLNAQAAEFTPGQTSSRKKSRGISETIRPVFTPLRSLDWRFGFIEVDYLESPVKMNHQLQHPPQYGNARSPLSPSRTLELPAIFEMRARSNSHDPSDAKVAERLKTPPSPGAGTLDLGFGVIHLYRDHLDTDDSEEAKASHTESSHHVRRSSNSIVNGEDRKSDEGSMVAILGVPCNWTTADLLAFIDNSVDSVHQMRIMRYVASSLPSSWMTY